MPANKKKEQKDFVRSREEIKKKILEIEISNAHVLKGKVASVFVNSTRAMMQLAAESQLSILHWMIGKEYKSRLKGTE